MRKTTMKPIILAFLLCACGGAQEDTSTPATTPTAEAPPVEAEKAPEPAPAEETPQPADTPATPQMSDAQIAGFLSAANQAEIAAGEVARKKAKKSEVKKLAEMMVKDHGAAEKEAKELLARSSLAPEEGDAARKLADDAKTAIDQLKSLKGAEFDRAYVESQVTMHQEVIDSVDQLLLPNVQNADLKLFIEGVRPKLAAHLEHAKTLQGKLTSP
ncbi:MAG TPA: DUF4142 domain-containing protein [Kofleriaceae bacterium]|nr:DUF4142 domain-containing protein [Kofleriaceae bacterium]